MFRKIIQVTSHHEGDILNITPQVNEALGESRIITGMVNLFVQHSTAALTMVEYETGVLSDLRRSLTDFAPDTASYAHNTKWGDGNGRSHVKASLIGPDLTIPVEKGRLMCGTWQQVVLLELDVNAGRTRSIVCTITGE
jgi:secondary thiamine-phosphate synthase enzyme